MKKFGAIGVVLVALAFLATGCVQKDVSAKSDETVCVFDGSDRGSQKLKYQILPGQEPKHADNNDEIVRIPTSFRFYAASRDRSVADAGAPEFYVGYARGNTAVQVEGQFKFRFDTTNACEWYARHGRRNANDGDLGFNARNNESASAFSPWVRWLNENFGAVGLATIRAASRDFTWPELVYGSDPDATKRGVAPDVAYGRTIGKVFTERLSDSLGGRFFCGTNAAQWGDEAGIDEVCPPVYFEVRKIVTEEPQLMAERAKTEVLRAQLENAAQQAELRKSRISTQQKDEKTQQQLLQEQVQTARLRALANPEVQKCLILARQGLDCDGKHPSRIVLGQSAR